MKFALTPAQFVVRSLQVAKEIGAPLTGYSGTIEHNKVKVAYKYDGVGQLTVDILHVPFPLTQGFVENRVTQWFKQ